jgi:hypothetical protein
MTFFEVLVGKLRVGAGKLSGVLAQDVDVLPGRRVSAPARRREGASFWIGNHRILQAQ